jgi:enhancer of polycomb-like protein
MTKESPYVCFRRREVKVARKTRRTDTQTIEKLVRLKSDLSSAQELLLKVLERERCKRELAVAEGKIFEDRVRMRELKRKLGEGQGDEALLVPRREKKRKAGMAPQASLG